MTQIITGTGLGTHGSSLGQLGSLGPKGTAKLGCWNDFVYVNAANGNMQLKQADGFLSDLGLDIDLFQTYNSRGEGSHSWSFNMDTRLIFEGKPNAIGSLVKRIDEDGHVSLFRYNEQKQAYLAQDGSTSKLTWLRDSWQYQEGIGQRRCHYNLEGQLTAWSDKDGHLLKINYQNGQVSSITDINGKQNSSWFFSKGLLRDVRFTSEGNVIGQLHYDYDALNRMTKVSRQLGEGQTYWFSYSYVGDTHLMSDINQSDGISLHIEYDDQSRVKRLVDGEGRVSTFDYHVGNTVVSNSLGESWSYFYDADSRLTGIDGPDNYHARYTYQGKHLVAVTQGKQLWSFKYNDTGDCVRLELPSGEIIQRTFDADHQILTETRFQSFDGEHHPIGPQTTRYVYDERGHLRFVVDASGVVTEHRYDINGLRISTRCYLRGRFNSKEVNPLKEVDASNALTIEELLQWVEQNNKQAISLKDYHYDWRGNLSEEIQYTQIDEQGEGILTHDTIKTYYRFDAAGHLVEQSSLTEKGLSTTHYFYDALGRLVKSIDNQNCETRIEYDDAHHRIIKTEPTGLQTISIFDKSGLLLSIQRLDKSHDYGLCTYEYDAASRLTRETDVSGKTTYFFYDAQGRIKARVTSTGQAIEYSYDHEGHCTATHQYHKQVDVSGFQKTLPNWNKIRPASSSQDRISQVVYNEHNQIAYQIDAQGAVIAYLYDAQGRVITKTAYANRLLQFSPEHLLDFKEVVLLPSTTKDRIVTYYYDSNGRLQGEINGEDAAIAYQYDALGHLIETCRYASAAKQPRTGVWRKDAPEHSINKDIHFFSFYNAAGLKIADIDAEGYLTEYRYNNRGLLIDTLAYYRSVDSSIIIDENSTLEALRPKAHSNDHHSQYRYDNLNQLLEEKRQNGLIITYTYNEAGLLLTKTSSDQKTHELRQQRYRYDALGRVIQSLDALGAALLDATQILTEKEIEAIWQQHSFRCIYDKAGRIQSKINALNQTTHYFYNENGLLIYTLSASGALTETRYNAFSQIETTIQYHARWLVNLADVKIEQLQLFLKSSADPRFDEVTHYEYNSLGLVTCKSKGSGNQVTTRYNAFKELDSSIKRFDSTHDITTSYEYDRRGLLRFLTDDLGGINKRSEAQYDIFGRMNKNTDGRQIQTSYIHDKRGAMIFIDRQGASRKAMIYDAFGRILRSDDTTDNSFIYNDQSNTLTLVRAGTKASVVTEFNAFGDKITLTDANQHITRFHYDTKGQLIQIEAPEQHITDFRYDAEGHLVFEQNSRDRIERFTYDAEGHVLSQCTDPKGLNLKSIYTYDGVGRQLSVTEGGCTTQFTYDNQGNLIKKCIDPQGLNLITEFSYTPSGQLARQTVYNSKGLNKVTAYLWDALGRCLSSTVDPDGLALDTHYEYDTSDNLVCHIDARQQRTQYIYDAENHIRFKIDPRGAVVEYAYDKKGNPSYHRAYENRVAQIRYNNEEELHQTLKSAAADQYQFFVHDTQSRLLMSYDSKGYATAYAYDDNDNLISKNLYAIPCSLDDLKAGGRPLPKANAESRMMRFAYDGLNRERFSFDSTGRLTEYRYNAHGELILQTCYSHLLQLNAMNNNYSIDNIEAHKRAVHLLDETIRYAYDKAGRLVSQVSPTGALTRYQYDEAGNLIATTRYASLLTQEQLAKENWSTEIKNTPQDRTSLSLYDRCGHELYRLSPMGKLLGRTYDANGNVLSERVFQKSFKGAVFSLKAVEEFLTGSQGRDELTLYKYDVVGRLRTKTDALNHNTSYAYDKNNNVLSKTEANNACWNFRYNESNQLIETSSPISTICRLVGGKYIEEQRSVKTQNKYDSFGNLIKTTRDADGLKSIIFYEYDTNNRQVAIYYPDSKVNTAGYSASSDRHEENKILKETFIYNAFGELIQRIDKAGASRYWAYDLGGRMVYALDAKNALTHYQYDSFDNVLKKTTYANPLILNKGMEYNAANIAQACAAIGSINDRHEFYDYDKDKHLLEFRKDAILSFNAQTKEYETLNPSNQYRYNTFGELIQTSVRINKEDWAITTTYYNNEGLKTAQINAEGYLITYEYDDFCRIATQTELAQRTTERTLEQYTKPKQSNKDRTLCFTYDALGQLTSKTLKNVSYSRLMKSGQEYETIKGDLTSSYGYDALGNLVRTTDPQGNTAYSYYNKSGQLTAKIGAMTKAGRTAETYAYDALGNLVEVKQWANGAGEVDEAQYRLKGASSKDIMTQNVYDSAGHLIEQTVGTGHHIYFSYDANGNIARQWQLVTQVDQTQVIQDKQYHYDAENKLIQTASIKSNGLFATKDLQYNFFGEVCAEGTNGDFTQHIEYDRAGRIWRSNLQGYYQIYVYDLTENVTQVVTSTNAFGAEFGEYGVDLSQSCYEDVVSYNKGSWLYDLQRQDNIYDKLGRLIEQIKDGTAKAQDRDNKTFMKRAKQINELDRWGNIILHQNANGYTTLYDYNTFDEVVKQKLPEVKVVDEHGVARIVAPEQYYAYDALGRAIAMTDANGKKIAKFLDAEGHIIRELDAKGAHRDKEYNLLGQMERSINELGYITRYTYDNANRLLSVTSDNRASRYVYDEAGQLIQQIDGLGQAALETRSWYDSLGNLIQRQHAGHNKYYEYDDEHHKTKERDALGNTQFWAYDKNGRLAEHKDLGGRKTNYSYNSNGLLLKEQSSSGKNKAYYYYSDGQLLRYEDKARQEIVDFAYDAQGNVISKGSSQVDGWILETDHYTYDALGRLLGVRRRNPKDTSTDYPNQDKSLLSIDYEYDAVGNIRDTKVVTNYPNYLKMTREDYYIYDENNRIKISKGQLQNNNIVMTSHQGSELDYDAVGNIITAKKFENGENQQYTYRYTKDNQVELVRKNNVDFQTKIYDSAGNVTAEHLYDDQGKATQHNRMDYKNGLLEHQVTKNRYEFEVSKTAFLYDAVDNLIQTNTQGDNGTYTQTHNYTYALWDNYQQEIDNTSFSAAGHATTYGQSLRTYDVNGQIKRSSSLNGGNSVEYFSSSLDGIRARKDSEGQTSYLNAGGKAIGDLRIDKNHTTHLEVYGGFTPTGIMEQNKPMMLSLMPLMWQNNRTNNSTPEPSFQRQNPITEDFPPNAPQDNLGTYTLQLGETLENIALQVYGDSSLWYLIADANGITDRSARAGEKDSQMHAGQRLNIPPAGGQHLSSATQKWRSTGDILGNTSAVAPMPTPLQRITKGNKSPWKILAMAAVAVIATVATVLSAGALGVMIGGIANSGGLSGLIGIGLSVLGGSSTIGIAATVGSGFAAGFIGSIAGQGAAAALRLQQGIDIKGALITGLATAATAGVANALSRNTSYQNLIGLMDKSSKEAFSIRSATEMMERDIVGQSINLSTRRQHHLDWLELSLSAATAGFMGSNFGKRFATAMDKSFKKLAPTVSSELQSFTTGALTSATTGTDFNPLEILTNNLGSALGNNLIQANADTVKEEIEELSEEISFSEQDLNKNKKLNKPYISNKPKGLNELLQSALDTAEAQSKGGWKKEGSYGDLSFSSDLFEDWKGEGGWDDWRFRPLANHLENIQSYTSPILGSLSMKYETGRESGEYLLASGTVSNGKNDNGGISYGAYQLSSKKNMVQDFLQNEGTPWAREFDGLEPTKVGAFGKKWKKIAANEGEIFFMAQHAYIERTLYKPVKQYILKKTGLNIDKQHLSVQNAVWSASVQHEKANFFLVEAINSIKVVKLSKEKYAFQLVKAIYAKRIDYVSKLHQLNPSIKNQLIYHRYPEERLQALRMLRD